MLNSTEAFLKPLERWVRAIREDDFHTARACSEELVRDGRLLAQHPDFQRCFAAHCTGLDPHQALFCLSQFLRCAGEGRSDVLKQFVRDPRRMPPP